MVERVLARRAERQGGRGRRWKSVEEHSWRPRRRQPNRSRPSPTRTSVSGRIARARAATPTKAFEFDQAEPEAKDEPAAESPADDYERIDLNRATFEQLRDVGFSVTQSTRVITYRERQSGFDSLDDLDGVPGMPDDFLSEVEAAWLASVD